MRTSSLLLVVIVLTLVPVTWAVEHVMVESKDLQWEDVSALPPGAKVAVIEGLLDQATPFILQFKFPADCKIPAHWHPSIAYVLVLSGTLNMGIGDKLELAKTHTLPVGSVSIIPAKINHFGWTQEETVVQVYR